MVPLSVVNPYDLSRCFGFNDDVVPYAELDGDSSNELISSWHVFGLRRVCKVNLCKPINGKL